MANNELQKESSEVAKKAGVAAVATPETPVRKKRRIKRKVARGNVHIHSSYNNTLVTITDTEGNLIAWSSAGKLGFKGPKKSTPYAAGLVSRDAVEQAKAVGLTEVAVFVKGVGTGREAAVRALQGSNLAITLIKDVTPIPHNGPMARKPRRV